MSIPLSRLCVVALLLAFALGAAGQEYDRIRYLGGFERCHRITRGPETMIAMAGSRLVSVFDGTDPAAPLRMSSWLVDGNIRGIAWCGDLLAVREAMAHGRRLLVLDMASPLQPELRGRFDFDIDEIAPFGTLLLGIRDDRLLVVGLENAEQPMIRGELQLGDDLRALTVRDSTACLASPTDIFIVDLRQPDQPQLLATLPHIHGENLGCLAMLGDRLYYSKSNTGVYIYSIADPGAPFEIGLFDPVFDVASIAAGDSVLHVFGREEGFTIARPVEGGLEALSSLDPGGTVYSGMVNGDRLWLADYSSAPRAVDVSDPSQPVPWPAETELPEADAIAVQGDRVWIAGNTGELIGIDAGDGQRPRVISRGPAWLGTLNSLALEGDLLAHGGGTSGVRLYTTTEDSLVERAWIEGNVVDLRMKDGLLYTVGAGFRIYDVSDPGVPLLLGSLPLFHGPRLDVHGDWAAVLDSGSDWTLFDVSDPTTPVETCHVGDDNLSPEIAIDGDLVYLNDIGGMRMWDVSQPDAPELAGYFSMPGTVKAITAASERVVFSNNQGLLQVMENSNPDEPVMLAELELEDSHGYFNRLVRERSRIYAGIDTGGLAILHYDDPALTPPELRLETVGVSIELSWADSLHGSWLVHRLDSPWQPLDESTRVARTLVPAWRDEGALRRGRAFYRVVGELQ